MRHDLLSRRLLCLLLCLLLLLGTIPVGAVTRESLQAPVVADFTIFKPIDPGLVLVLSVPSELTAVSLSDYRISLRGKDNATTETGYYVERKKSGSSTWTEVGSTTAISGSGSYASLVDSSHALGNDYVYRVYAAYSGSYSPAYSNEATVSAAAGAVPAVPVNLHVVASTGDQVELAWDYPAIANVSNYVLQYGDLSGTFTSQTLEGYGHAYTITGLKEQSFFQVRLQARNWSTGSSAFCTAVNANTLPNAPGNLACAPQADGIRVSWSDNSLVENWYVVHRREGAGAWSEVTSVAKNTTEWTDTTAVSGKSYTYRVRGVSMLGYSSLWSGEYTTTAGAVPATPTPSASATPSPSASPSASASASAGSLPVTASAKPNAATVLVNGEPVAFEAYNINGYNYFKLRDLAMSINGTGKQFEVKWNAALKAIDLLPGQAYTPAGGEFAQSGLTATVIANRTTAAITLNGGPVSLGAYNIRNNNYFKLRDIGQTLNFGVDYDTVNRIIKIDTTKGYTNP